VTSTQIASVELVRRELPPQPDFRWRAGLPSNEPARTGGALVITTEDGHVGRATTSRGVIAEDIVTRRLAPELLGQDPLAREHLWHRVWELDRIEEFPLYVLGLADIALWDLAGKMTGLPLHRLLGYARESIPAYASTVTYGSIEEFLDVADQCLAYGFRSIKLHAWGNARKDAELCRRLREHVGDDVELMYDGSAAFDLSDAIHLGRALSEAGYRWYEEPMREFSITAHRQLAAAVDVPLLVAETSDGAHWNTADFIAARVAPYVRTSAAFKGGITGALRIAHLADAFHLRAEVHGMGPISRSLCMAIPNTTAYEALVWGNPIVTDPCVGSDGRVHASQAPGIDYDAPAAPW
jgi:L-alanine-DL-glutamate epimerase-like enolase superfamily enzyme